MAKGKKLSADLPVAWLTDPGIRGLSPVAWWLHSFGIMWSLEHETDGELAAGTIVLLRPPKTATATVERAIAELVQSGLWERRGDNSTIRNWADTQTTHAQFEAARARWRNSKRGGANPADEPVRDEPPDSPGKESTFQVQFHGGSSPEPSYPVGKGTEEERREEKITEEQPSWGAHYDDAYAVDPGLGFEDEPLMDSGTDEPLTDPVTGKLVDWYGRPVE